MKTKRILGYTLLSLIAIVIIYEAGWCGDVNSYGHGFIVAVIIMIASFIAGELLSED